MSTLWTSDLEVGHPTIDAQHQEIFARLNRLVPAMAAGDRGEVGRLFDFLGAYVTQHFAEEETLMTSRRYPAAPAHRLEHQEFVATFAKLRSLHDKHGANAAVAIELKNTVGGWLRTHIRGTDQKFAAFLAGA